MCAGCVGSRAVGFGGASPMFLGSGEICFCHVTEDARAPTGAAAISPKPLLPIASQHRSLCRVLGAQRRKRPSVHSILAGEPSWSSFPAAVTGFLSGAVSTVSSSSALMGLLVVHLAVCLEITSGRTPCLGSGATGTTWPFR